MASWAERMRFRVNDARKPAAFPLSTSFSAQHSEIGFVLIFVALVYDVDCWSDASWDGELVMMQWVSVAVLVKILPVDVIRVGRVALGLIFKKAGVKSSRRGSTRLTTSTGSMILSSVP
ncbi:hypothetical protein JAAARDRAFT_33225 [Jaapia argillacea MUCL 33604]|uniref:Uncharacterized protein n=1 Tax=Jaapia argillacea MUCL 33604 TaxID=933084 RepID=A0A067PY68_9AGAM|nr:hypothetical protein JAAARDRAFT_33225 [Jaapia argillacea MUCL 33604]